MTSTTATYTVTGMTCGHCVQAVTSAFTDLGASEVDVELETGAVTVTSPAPLDPDAVATAIDDAGYTLAP
ncbi:MAG TPA: cation transporter [Acidimicrobiales bacterium]|nr:cation transporter [Acidimicrobiales bacterium]